MDALNQALIDIAVAIVSIVGLWLLTYIRAKVIGTKYALLASAAVAGIAYAEEKAAVQLKTYGRKLPSDEKATAAAAYILRRLPGVTEEEARDIVQAHLPQVQQGAAGFLKATATAIQTPVPPPAG
ncbi:MAG: hypothetical protein ABIG68_09155 [Acidobacteriota bacterium]